MCSSFPHMASLSTPKTYLQSSGTTVLGGRNTGSAITQNFYQSPVLKRGQPHTHATTRFNPTGYGRKTLMSLARLAAPLL